MLNRVITKALRSPWAITPEYGAIVFDVLRARAQGLRLSDEEIQLRIEAQTGQRAVTRAESRTDGVIAVIPVHGVICNRAFEASSGSTSAEYLSRAIERADADPNIKAVLFDHSSPGGVVEGVPETAKMISRMVKPTVAFVDALSASAAYWLATQADEIVCRESGYVGSVGVYCLTEDWSEYLKKEGIKINAISAGDYKLEGASWEPLSDEARAFLQASVDATYAKFLAAVASGRGTSVADVKKHYGQGRCLSAVDAKAVGMIDRVGELEVAIARANALAKAGTARASSMLAERGESRTLALGADTGDRPGAERVDRAPVTVAGRTGPRVSPNADGDCPDGYEMGEDGMCHLDDQTDGEEAHTLAASAAQADRDRLALAQA